MRKWIATLALLAMFAWIFLPSVSFTEDSDTVLLARSIYALGKEESYATKLALGSVVMNRVENNWFADTLGDVLNDQQQFPAGKRYDDESLQAAHAVLSGERTLNADALYYQPLDASNAWGEENLLDTVGNYNFYSMNGNV